MAHETSAAERPIEPRSALAPIVIVAVDRGHRGMSQLADCSEGIAFLAHQKELLPNLRLAHQAKGDRGNSAPVVVVLPSSMPSLIPVALAGGAERVVAYHTTDAPRTRWTEIGMRAAGALVDWVIAPDLASLKSAVRHGADPDRIDVIDLSQDCRALFARIAREPRRRNAAEGAGEVAASLMLDALDLSGVLSIAERFGGGRGVNVVNYHRILPFDELRTYCRPQMAMAASVFEAQLEAMAERGFVSLRDVREPSSAGRVSITFDDGYEDNFRIALPLLRRFSAPACVFVVTSLIGEPDALWWDRVGLALFAYWRSGAPVPIPDELPRRARALESVGSYQEARDAITEVLSELNQTEPRERALAIEAAERLVSSLAPARTMLSWDEIREMRKHGFDFGAHTRTHVSLDEVTPERAREELLGSITDLEARVPDVSERGRVAALPRGKLGPLDERELSALGFASVMSTTAGVNNPQDDTVIVKRRDGKYLTLRGRHHPAKLRLELSGLLDRIRREYDD